MSNFQASETPQIVACGLGNTVEDTVQVKKRSQHVVFCARMKRLTKSPSRPLTASTGSRQELAVWGRLVPNPDPLELLEGCLCKGRLTGYRGLASPTKPLYSFGVGRSVNTTPRVLDFPFTSTWTVVLWAGNCTHTSYTTGCVDHF